MLCTLHYISKLPTQFKIIKNYVVHNFLAPAEYELKNNV